MAPTLKPYAAIGSTSSSSEEDSSTSSGDEREAEPQTLLLAPAPADQEGDSYESDDDDDYDDDGGDSFGSSDVTAKRGPPPPPHLHGQPEPHSPPGGNVPSPKLTKRAATTADLAEPSPSKKKKARADVPSKHMATPAKEVSELPEKAVAAKKVTKLAPLKKPAAAGAARKGVSKKHPPPSKAAAAGAWQTAGKEVAYSAEKRLEEKSETYCHLAQVLKALETEHKSPGLYNAAFLSVSDDKAAMLDTKIKKQRVAEIKLFLKRNDIHKEVIRVMSNSI